MIISASNRFIFSWLWIRPFAHETSLKHKILTYSLNVCILSIQTLTLISSILVVFTNIKCDANECMYAVAQIIPLVCSIFSLLYVHFNRRQIEGIFLKMDQIYEGIYILKYNSIELDDNGNKF